MLKQVQHDTKTPIMTLNGQSEKELDKSHSQSETATVKGNCG